MCVCVWGGAFVVAVVHRHFCHCVVSLVQCSWWYICVCVCAVYNSWPVAGRGSFFACSSPVDLYNDLQVAVCGHLCLCESIGRGFPAMSIVMLAHIHQTFCFASIFMQCACRVARIDVAYNLKSHAKACEHCYCVSACLQSFLLADVRIV